MRFFRLTATLFVASLPLSAGRLGTLFQVQHKKYKLSSLVILLAVLVLGWLFLDAFFWNVINTVNLIRRTEIVFFLAILLSWILCFFAGVIPARERFSYSPEDELWRAIPVSPVTRALASFTALFLLLLPLHLFLYLPALFVYLRFAPHDPRWLAGAAAGILLAPVAPVIMAAAVALMLRRFPRFSRGGLAVEIVLVVLVIALLALAQITLQHALMGAARGDTLIFPVRLSFFLGDLARSVPPADWLASIFRPGEELRYLFGAVMFCLVLAVPVIAWAVRIMGRNGHVRPPVKGNTAPWSGKKPFRVKDILPRKPLTALILRESKLLFAQSPLVFEAVLRLLVLPAFLILYLAVGPREFTSIVAAFIASSPLATIIAIGCLVFIFDISFLAATGLSREGYTVALSISLPVDGALQVKAKTLFLLILSLPPAALSLILVYLLFPVPPETLVCTVPGVSAYLLFSIVVGLLLDYRRPVFSRTGPMIRQNANTILSITVEAAVLVLLGAIAGGALLVGISPLAAAFLAVQLLVLTDIILLPRLFRYAASRQVKGWE